MDWQKRLVGLHIADPADLAYAKGAADVRVAEIDVLERAVGAFSEVDNVAIGTVHRSVRRLEVEDSSDIPIDVQGQSLDPVLRVVGEKITPLVSGRELAAVVDESARNGGVATVMSIGVNGAGVGRRSRSFVLGPPIVCALRAEVHLLLAVA